MPLTTAALDSLDWIRPFLDAVDPSRRRHAIANGRLHLEIHVPPGEDFLAFAADLERRLAALPGIETVHVNAPLARVVLTLRADAPPVAELERIVAGVEATHGLASAAFAREIEHPADEATLARLALEMGADGAAFLTAVVGRFLRVGVFPLEIDLLALVSLLRGTPRLREVVDRLLGGQMADLALTSAGAFVQALAQRPLGPMVDVAYRTLLGAEMLARRGAWLGREADLFARAAPVEALAEEEARPVPLPPGAIESFAEKAIYGALGAFGISFSATGNLAAAAAPLVGGTPRPAHVGRQSFASWLGRALAARGIVVLDPSALRRLDRVDTVVLDGRLVASGSVEVGVVVPLGDEPLGDLADRAIALLDPYAPAAVRSADGWTLEPLDELLPLLDAGSAEKLTVAIRCADPGSKALALLQGDRPAALVAVRPAADPQLDGLLAAARRAGLELQVAATDPQAVALVPEERLLETDPANPRGLARAVRSLQKKGKVVCLVASGPGNALAAADVAIGLTRDHAPPPWSADLLCGPLLDDARVLLEACAPARDASSQSVYVAESAAAASLLLTLGGLRWTTTARVASAVDVASIVAMVNGIRLGARAAAPPALVPRDPIPWHAFEVARVLDRLGSSEEGLSSAEGERRRRTAASPPSSLARFAAAAADELASPLTPFLGIAAALSAAVGSVTDAVMVAGVSAFDAVVGAAQRVSTESAVARLGQSERRPVRVLRDGVEITCDAGGLVRGDVIRLEAGDVVPADCRIVHAHMLEVDESSLTGESLPVDKSDRPCLAATVAERTSMLYDGTSIAAGRARAVVVATGDATEAQRAHEAAATHAPDDGVELRLRALMNLATPVSIASGLVVATSGLLRGRTLAEVVSTGVGLAVAAVPEGLPMVATMAQLAASRRLAERGALAQNLHAVEALGRIDLLCVDKTGTLTEGRIALSAVSDGEQMREAAALGPAGRAILAAALRATPVPSAGRKLPHPTDRALLKGAELAAVGVTTDLEEEKATPSTSAGASGIASDAGGLGDAVPSAHAAEVPEAITWQPLAELPFEPARAYHAVLGRLGGGFRLSVKGAPEVLLERCAAWRRDGALSALDDAARERLVEQSHLLARQGLRVLAVAERALPANGSLADDQVAELVLRGFVALSDKVRPTARGAVATLRRAGVRVVMMTGDHPSTAERIAAELDLLGTNGVLTGAELDHLDDAELAARLPGVRVLARLTPTHKVRLVRAYQRLGHVVGMTGDGANDAPAIRLAHVGIALGTRATSAARTAADVVITDDRIETLVDAVIEGRGMWASVRDAIAALVGGNLGEVLFIVSSSLVSGAAPLNARQLLLVNLLTDAAPALAIALRPPPGVTPEQLLREGPDVSLGPALERDILLRGFTTAGATSAAWVAARLTGRAARASTVAFTTLVTAQLAQTLAVGGRSPLVVGSSLASFGLTAAIVQTPGLSQLFGCTPLGPIGWAITLTSSTLATGASVVLPRLLPPPGDGEAAMA